MQFVNVNFAFDSKITTNAFHNNRIDVTKFGQVIITYINVFVTHFTRSKVKFNRR